MFGGLAGYLVPVPGGTLMGAAGGAALTAASHAPEGLNYLIDLLLAKLNLLPDKQPVQVSTVVNLDGQQIAKVVTKHIARDGAGAPEGAPYHDSTHSFTPPDFSLAY